MDPKDFPKRYGGELNWDWGDMPNLDEETRTALEGDGNKGWVRGPCLWLDGKRVPVGTEKGKPRRPLVEVEKMKPIVYAADYTEVPVHPNKRLSVISKASNPKETGVEHHKAEELAVESSGGATVANTIAAKSNSEQQAQVPLPQSEPERELQPQSHIKAEMPELPPQPPTTSAIAEPHSLPHKTAAILEPPPQPHTASATAELQPVDSVPAPVESTPAPSISQPSRLLSAATTMAPPSQPHQSKPVDEPVSVSAPMTNGNVNGHATGPKDGYPQVVLADDSSRETAVETENPQEPQQKKFEAERPPMERFVTALEG